MSEKNNESLYERLLSLHETSYLSLMSIVQGVALGSFLFAIQQHGLTTSAYSVANVPLLICTMVIIIVTWNEYVSGVAAFKWIPNVLDASIPFLFCASEIWMSAMMFDVELWYWGASSFSVIAVFAYLNMYHRANKHPANKDVFKGIGYHRHAAVAYAALGVIVFTLPNIWPSLRASAVMSVIALSCVIGFAIRGHYYLRRLISLSEPLSG